MSPQESSDKLGLPCDMPLLPVGVSMVQQFVYVDFKPLSACESGVQVDALPPVLAPRLVVPQLDDGHLWVLGWANDRMAGHQS